MSSCLLLKIALILMGSRLVLQKKSGLHAHQSVQEMIVLPYSMGVKTLTFLKFSVALDMESVLGVWEGIHLLIIKTLWWGWP